VRRAKTLVLQVAIKCSCHCRLPGLSSTTVDRCAVISLHAAGNHLVNPFSLKVHGATAVGVPSTFCSRERPPWLWPLAAPPLRIRSPRPRCGRLQRHADRPHWPCARPDFSDRSPLCADAGRSGRTVGSSVAHGIQTGRVNPIHVSNHRRFCLMSVNLSCYEVCRRGPCLTEEPRQHDQMGAQSRTTRSADESLACRASGMHRPHSLQQQPNSECIL